MYMRRDSSSVMIAWEERPSRAMSVHCTCTSVRVLVSTYEPSLPPAAQTNCHDPPDLLDSNSCSKRLVPSPSPSAGTSRIVGGLNCAEAAGLDASGLEPNVFCLLIGLDVEVVLAGADARYPARQETRSVVLRLKVGLEGGN
jgi:hypothetical protein